MTASYKSRLLIWTGPVYAVLFLAAGLLLEGDTPGEKSSGAEVIKYYNGHSGRTLTEVFAAPAIVALLVLFAAELRARARALGDRGAGPSVMFGGAVLLGAGMLTGAFVSLGLASASDHHQAQVAQTLNVLGNADWIPFIAGLAVFLLGAGITVLRTGMLPKWLGWVALVGGVVSLAGPGGFIGYFAAPLWIIVAGIMLGVRKDETGVASTSDVSRATSVTP